MNLPALRQVDTVPRKTGLKLSHCLLLMLDAETVVPRHSFASSSKFCTEGLAACRS